jgi:hypothetical protein
MHHLINLSVVPFTITLLPVLVAVMLTGALCTAVFGTAYALSLLDSWLQDRAEWAGRRDAERLATLAVAGLLSALAGRPFVDPRLARRYRRALGSAVTTDRAHIRAANHRQLHPSKLRDIEPPRFPSEDRS